MNTASSKLVFCIDDDPDILALHAMLLEDIGGIRVACFEGAQPALDALATMRPDLILLDIIMPEMDGIIAYKKIIDHPAWQSIPVAFVTGRKSPEALEQYKAMGVPVITKPVDGFDFQQTVKAFLHEAVSSAA